MPLVNLSSLSQLDGILAGSKDKLSASSVIDFYATWCGPCRVIAPIFEKLSGQYPNVNFLKCDVDNVTDVAQKYKVTAMPTFVFLKGSSEIHRIRGADARGLESTIKTHAGTGGGSGSGSATAFTGKGQTLAGSSSNSTSSSPSAASPSDLITNLDPQVKVLLALVGGYLLLWYMTS
ncbi:hypothetical protein Clacol_007205 [Clathrus columnatus]|uniref:Thioredoxin n=1 Tax=Clathrus columnatus TaxID=1419009 RepID=A0AAV5AJU0_9AGAM|nr:hypothetical protein Clacol_007205 [Clathrus columnatus]